MAFASFQHYLKAKREKLSKQQETQGTLFNGLVLYFNGAESHIKEQAIKHGAKNQDYFNSNVDFIIAPQMTLSKQKQLRKPVLRPQWVLDSIEKGIRQPVEIYLLFQADPKQKKLQFSSPLKSDTTPKKRPTQRPDLDLDDPAVRTQLCTAPGFLQRYFETSRLHHLSTWKQDLIHQTRKEMKARRKRDSCEVENAVIMHVDMDCFFASVMIREHPELIGKPVVVSHSVEGNNSTADVASCNYEARKFGIRNGYSVGKCKTLCPDLHILQYDFKSIKECTDQIYKIFYEIADFVQAVSCDEAILAVTDRVDSMAGDRKDCSISIAEQIRKRIHEETRCTASVGIGHNILTARIATKKAKPNGVHFLDSLTVVEELGNLRVSDLPGVGWSTTEKLESMGITTCSELRELPLELLKSLGEKQGTKLYLYARGIDNQPLENKEQSTTGSEVNWAVRFRNSQEYQEFVKDLSIHVFDKMFQLRMTTRHITVNAKKRNYTGEPSKYLGCGHCVDFSKSQHLDRPIKTAEDLFQYSWKLFGTFGIPAQDVRGVGIHVKLQAAVADASDFFRKRKQQISPEKGNKKQCMDMFDWIPRESQIDEGIFNELPLSVQEEQKKILIRKELQSQHMLPSFSQIDPEVLRCLPKHIQKEQMEFAKKKPKTTPQVIQQDYIAPAIGGIQDFDSVLELIGEWMLHCKKACPLDEDVLLVTEYLASLVKDLEMDQCCVYLKLLSRGFGVYDKKGKCRQDLVEIFHFILDTVNSTVQDAYGCALDPRAYM
jgi:DNA repair protein REV1